MGAAAETFAEAAVIEHRSGFRRRWYRTPSFVAGASILGTIILLALLAPVASWHDPVQQDLLHILQGPSWTHPLGTDEPARIFGSRSSPCSFRS
jgi:peptide/nickel transport system permease protein